MIKAAGPELATAILNLAYAAQPELLAIKELPFGERAAKYLIRQAITGINGDAQRLPAALDAALAQLVPPLKRGDADQVLQALGAA